MSNVIADLRHMLEEIQREGYRVMENCLRTVVREELEAERGREQLYEPRAATAWIRANCPDRGKNSGALRAQLSRLPERKQWPTRAELEELIAALGGDQADLPDPLELLTLVDVPRRSAA
jgi:hypothetical protein